MRLLLFLLPVLLLDSCSSSIRSKEELVKYVQDPDNGLLKQVDNGRLTVKVYYKPVDLVMSPDEKTDSSPYSYFTAEMCLDGKDLETFSLVNQPISQFLLNPAPCFSIETTKRRLPVLHVAYQPLSDITNSTTFLLVTEDISRLANEEEEIRVSINAPFLGNEISLSFSIPTIKKTPHLLP